MWAAERCREKCTKMLESEMWAAWEMEGRGSELIEIHERYLRQDHHDGHRMITISAKTQRTLIRKEQTRRQDPKNTEDIVELNKRRSAKTFFPMNERP